MSARKGWLVGLIIVAVMFFMIFVILVMMMGISFQGDFDIAGMGNKIAVIELQGVIYNSQRIVTQFEKYRKDESIAAIVFRIDSPGGGVAESQEIYEAVKKSRNAGKNVVVSMGSVAASGGYYIACGADTIVANPGTTTGSIGVIAEIPNTKALMDKIGIRFNIVKSGRFKDTGSPFRDITSEERAYLQGWIDDAYHQFVNVISEERKMDVEDVLKLADGRVFTGKQAESNGLIDVLGTYQDAIHIAAQMAGLSGEPNVVREKRKKVTLFDLLFMDMDEVFNMIQGGPRLKYQMIL
ncbi:signal peptide peptidase SppA [candidate division KSB1 bacterium]|nr:signal peptide peptidase SppA [candidate division KSB1 bacterium]